MDAEKIYQQLMFEEMRQMSKDAKPIRVSFHPNTDTYRQLMILAAQQSSDPRTIVQSAVRVFFTAYLFSRKNEPANTPS